MIGNLKNGGQPGRDKPEVRQVLGPGHDQAGSGDRAQVDGDLGGLVLLGVLPSWISKAWRCISRTCSRVGSTGLRAEPGRHVELGRPGNVAGVNKLPLLLPETAQRIGGFVSWHSRRTPGPGR